MVSKSRPTSRRNTARSKTIALRESTVGAANSTANRAIDVLFLFSDDRPVWSTGEIAAHYRMPRTTTHRYLNTLRSYGLLVEDRTGGYRLGPRIFPLARVAKESSSILNIATPHLEALNARFGEAITFYERLDHEAIALSRLESHHRVRLTYVRGQLLPWPATASSKVLLAYADAAEQAALFELMEPVRYTITTISNFKALRQVLNTIQRQGYAYSDQERDTGIRGIAAPVFSREQARYCVTMSGPTFRMTDAALEAAIASVKETASRITVDLRSTEY